MRFTLPAALAAATLLIQPALADSLKVGTLEITNLWARATPPRAVAGGGFMTITNTGDEPDRLVALSSPIAAVGEVHEMKVEDGIMTMRPLKDGLEIPAHGSISLAPGGYHVMLIDLKEPIVAGTDVPVTLTFARAGVVETELRAAPIGAPGPEGGDGGKHDGTMQEGQTP
jgi:hypothetical protein